MWSMSDLSTCDPDNICKYYQFSKNIRLEKNKQTKKKDIRTSVCRIRLKKSEYKHEMMWSDVVSSVDAIGYVETMS